MEYICAPFADSTLRVAEHISCSFHALPLSRGACLRGSIYSANYDALLGNLHCELSVGSPFLDCLAIPEIELLVAERMAAKAFGSDVTLFGTSGTTVSNEIAIRALIPQSNTRVLADRGLHQSVHFALTGADAKIDYIPCHTISEEYNITVLNISEMESMLLSAEQDGEPYEVLVINGQSYEGFAYNVESLIHAIVRSGSSLRKIFVDEAWGAANYFHPLLRQSSAMAAANSSISTKNNFTVVATQSAHKSLSTLRQASLIYIKGSESIAELLRSSRCRYHTTSPNVPIVASIDLARAQISSEGHGLLEQAIQLASEFRDIIQLGKVLPTLKLAQIPDSQVEFQHVYRDPTKILVYSMEGKIDGKSLRNALYNEFGIYVSRVVGNAVLLNFHIGIRDSDPKYLLNSLKKIEQKSERLEKKNDTNDFVIPYPPGVPAILPGEPLDSAAINRISMAKSAGSTIISIKPQRAE